MAHENTKNLGADAAAVEETGAIVPADAATARRPYRIWALWMPFKKSGFPSLGTFGATERKVVIIPMETWNTLCAENPGLQTTQFEVGSYE
jgi:hypothetical protein